MRCQRHRVAAAALLVFLLAATAPVFAVTLTDTWYEWGISARDSSNYEEAAMYFEWVVDADPNHSSAWYQLGWVRLQLGAEPADTIAAFRRHLTIDPADGKAHNDLGVAYSRAGKTFDALLAYTRAVTLEPSALHRSNLGHTLLASYGRADLAFEQYAEIVMSGQPDADERAPALLDAIYPQL